MIAVLVPTDDVGMWLFAKSALYPSMQHLISVLPADLNTDEISEAKVILVDTRAEEASDFMVPGGCDVLVDLGRSERLLSIPGFDVTMTVFQAERYGSYNICHVPVSILVRGEQGAAGLVRLPRPVTGPGAATVAGSEFVTWPTEMFDGLGYRVSRDERSVIEAVYAAVHGDGPLWVRPGFPFRVPASPSTFRTLEGAFVEGLLCTSVNRAGGWVVLDKDAVLLLLGNRTRNVSWPQIQHIIGVQAAAALLGWLCGFITSSPSSAKADTSTTTTDPTWRG